MENYGDMLFPLILEDQLSTLCEEIVHVAPTGGPPVWEDCVSTIGFDEFIESHERVDGVIIGGGQVVRTAPTSLGIYDKGGISAFTAYPSVWLGAAYAAAQHNVPLCWNAPGVSQAFGPVASQLVNWTASVTDYLAVRDEISRHTLEKTGVPQDISVVPDSAAEVSGLWSEKDLSEAYQKVFVRRNLPIPRRALAFHVNSRWAGEETGAIAARIDRMCEKLGATPILLTIGPCHGDGEVQRRVSHAMRTDHVLIEQPQSLLEITACIALSEAYFGSSLHGMIAACSFGTRGMLVASKDDNKYPGFLDQLGLSSWLVESWAEAERRAGELFTTPEDTWKHALQPVRPILDGHWERMRETLSSNNKSFVSEDSPEKTNDKRSAVERLQHIGEDRYKHAHIFQPLITENLESSGAKIRELGQELRQERQKFRETRKSLMLLRRWMETVDESLQELWESRQWRTGHAARELHRKVLRRPKKWGAREQLDSQLQRFRYWNEELERSEKEPPDDG